MTPNHCEPQRRLLGLRRDKLRDAATSTLGLYLVLTVVNAFQGEASAGYFAVLAAMYGPLVLFWYAVEVTVMDRIQRLQQSQKAAGSRPSRRRRQPR